LPVLKLANRRTETKVYVTYDHCTQTKVYATYDHCTQTKVYATLI